jgi:hypothetical protein
MGGSELARESRKRDFGHGFSSGLAWEKESEEENAFRVLEQGVGDRGRGMMVRRGTAATASKRRDGKGRAKGTIGRRGPLPQGGTPVAARGNREAARRRPRCSGGRIARLRVLRSEDGGCGLAGPRARDDGFIGRLRGLDMRAYGAARMEAVPCPSPARA